MRLAIDGLTFRRAMCARSGCPRSDIFKGGLLLRVRVLFATRGVGLWFDRFADSSFFFEFVLEGVWSSFEAPSLSASLRGKLVLTPAWIKC